MSFVTGCNQQSLPDTGLWGIQVSCCGAVPPRYVNPEKWLDVQGLMNFTAAHTVPPLQTVSHIANNSSIFMVAAPHS